ncbi:Fe-S protein assembly co-chaperone HscB [Sphaceloma murrayae]|uniref:Fe-S protein assembly co-chaperone HscB n=1 Tax=Sphaceloma murrayae TaxID=2082308 RepID=A0A2K1QSU9_9PEZI|nr:Fe-S protein assembly co-chaperone HscB [Sphaceloma murrayae]
MRSQVRSRAAQALRSSQARLPQARRYSVCPRCTSALVQSSPLLSTPSVARRKALPPGSSREQSTSSTVKESLIPQTFYEYFPILLGPDRIPPKGPFKIDVKALRKEFLQLQAKAHPDLAPHGRKRQAEGLSARINEAYKTLQNPLLRAQYLLSLRGIDVAEDETAKVEDPELLMEVLETRETIEEAQSESDLEPLKVKNEGRIEESEEILGEAFKSDDMDRAKEEAVRLRYWVNIRESIDGWEKGKPVVLVH